MIDLHCHSTYSDGALSPQQLVERALHLQLSCLSLTDHDTIAGYDELYQAVAGHPLTLIRGIEFSTRWKKHEIHILGYHIQPGPILDQLITRQTDNRIARAQLIGAALGKMGINSAYDKACMLAGHHRVGRPHFAQLLVNEGRARDMQAAFKQFLVRGKPAYVTTVWLSVTEAVAGILAAGGQAVIAHPLKYGLTRSKLHELINEFKEAGGAGIEVVSGDVTMAQIKEMAATCARFDLLASSGSDYHADGVSRVNLGKQQSLPLECTPIWRDWTI